MTFKEYMSQTEFAVKQLFDSLKYYRDLLEKEMTIRPVYSDNSNCSMEEFWKKSESFFDDNKEQNDVANKISSELLGLKDSQALICGSILQVAFTAISKFSTYDGECLVLKKKNIKFGIGRDVNNIPLGLVIYAGRNQYNHWDDEKPHYQTKELFDLIATRNNKQDYKDPCFNLDLDVIDIYSHNILGLIGWKTYEDYEKDMIDMLREFEEVK